MILKIHIKIKIEKNKRPEKINLNKIKFLEKLTVIEKITNKQTKTDKQKKSIMTMQFNRTKMLMNNTKNSFEQAFDFIPEPAIELVEHEQLKVVRDEYRQQSKTRVDDIDKGEIEQNIESDHGQASQNQSTAIDEN